MQICIFISKACTHMYRCRVWELVGGVMCVRVWCVCRFGHVYVQIRVYISKAPSYM